jgi:EPS-associated MarR family transcriptional regulator
MWAKPSLHQWYCHYSSSPVNSRSISEQVHRPTFIVSPDLHHYKLLKLIEANPAIQQREMAKAMGVSLGKINYCLKALMQKGLVKMDNFRRADNKLAYSYLLTPSGIEEKTRLTVSFLKYKVAEYEAIRNEIEQLRQEADREASA